MPIIETYRGVGIHAFQDAQRVKNIVKPAIDAVFALSAPADLYRFAADKTQVPESRLLAAARYQAQHEAHSGSHEQRPGRLEHLRAAIAGLKSLDWADTRYYGTSLQPHAPGETRVPRPLECVERLRAAR